jgi:PAS domain S-box-containing protein
MPCIKRAYAPAERGDGYRGPFSCHSCPGKARTRPSNPFEAGASNSHGLNVRLRPQFLRCPYNGSTNETARALKEPRMAIRLPLDDREKLRAEAEIRFVRKPPADSSLPPTTELLHELQVHQIELEMQNEELRRAHAALEESTEKYAKLYEHVYHFAPVGYFTVSNNGVILDVNLTGAALLGEERKGLVGRRFAGFVSREDGDRWHYFLRALKQPGDWLSIRLVVRTKSGSALHARLDCDSSVRDDKTSVVQIVLTDISEQVRAENALRERQEQLDIVLGGSREGYWDWSEGGETVITERTREILGLADRGLEIIVSSGMQWTKRVHPDDLPAFLSRLAELESARSEQVEIDFQWGSANKTWKWVRARGRVLSRDGRGKAIRVAGTVTDVSEHRRLGETLRRTEAREARYADMVRNFPGGAIGLFDQDRRLVLVEGAGVVGNKQSLVEGLLVAAYPPEHRERVASALQAALAGRMAEVETHLAGEEVELRAGPVLDSEGRVVMGVVTVHPTTKRRGAATRVDRR